MSIRQHTPQRTCVSCRTVKAKQGLIRFVRVPDGSVAVDTSGKTAGRGAYMCRSQGCWQVGLSGNQLEHVLRTTLTQGNREQLISYGKDLLQGVKQ